MKKKKILKHQILIKLGKILNSKIPLFIIGYVMSLEK